MPNPPAPGSAAPAGEGRGDLRDLWPRDFGRDGVSGLVDGDRAMRARDVSRPRPSDDQAAEAALPDLLARVEGRRPTGGQPRGNTPSRS